MLTARDNALRVLGRWHVLSEPPMLPDRVSGTGGMGDEAWASLAPRDRAFAFDLVTGVIRWRGLLDHVIASRLKQPLDSLDHPVQVLLWLGAYQLLLQGGTSDYAAVDTTVDMAKRSKTAAKASGLINAVLRGITRFNPARVPRRGLSRRSFEIDFATQVDLNTAIFPDPLTAPTSHLAATRSHPRMYVDFLRRHFKDDLAAKLLLRNNQRPTITLRADADAVDAPAMAGLVAHASAKRFLVAAEGWNQSIDTLVNKGILSPQDPTSARPVRAAAEILAAGSPPKRVLDLCAGLGTKSIQLARTFPDALIVSSDTDVAKLSRLMDRAQKIGIKNIRSVSANDLASEIEAGGQFDLVLVDVPCSNTGVMGKRVQSRWRWVTLDHVSLHVLQKNLLTQGAAYLKTGGTLIYSTCSLDPAENEKLIEELAAEFPQGLKVIKEESTLPSLSDEIAATNDGGYFAIMQ